MALTLDSIILQSPALVGDTLSVDVDLLPLVIDTDPLAVAVDVTIPETGQLIEFTTFTEVGGKHRFSFEAPIPSALGTYRLSIRSKDTSGTGYTKVSPSYTLTILRASNVEVPEVLPPAGVQVQRLANFVRVKWQMPQLEGFLGVRVKVSADSSGVTTPYLQQGGLITSSSATQRDTLSTTVAYHSTDDGLHKITTTDEALVNTPYSKIDFPKSQVDAEEFYAMLTTVLQDPDTHHVHESYAVGPFKCSFVDLRRVQVADFPPGYTPEDHAIQLINNLSQMYPGLDLAPRSEERDVQVDPVALELANQSTRLWFASVAQSVDALAQVDDTDGDGVSDPASTNTYKQAIAQAFRLSDTQVQVMIDKQFDVLGARAGVTRGGLQASTVDVTFFVLYRPTKRIDIQEGGIVNTLPDSTTPSISFKILGSAVMDPVSADSYYNVATNRWSVTLPCQCLVDGSIGNVGGGTIRTVLSGTSSPMLCANEYAADFGLDRESNRNFASRIADRAVVGIDSGRRLGYKGEAQKAYGVVDVKVVCSGDLEMLRDWDSLRQKHVFGCVDIFARGRSVSHDTLRFPYVFGTDETFGVQKTYRAMRMIDPDLLHIGFTADPPSYNCAALVELAVVRAGVTGLDFYFGTTHARFDDVSHSFYLDPEDLTYTKLGDVVTPGLKNSAMLSAIGSSTLSGIVSQWSPLAVVPPHQPVTRVYSAVGESGKTGALPASLIRLIKSDDPLLLGGSTLAKDRVSVENQTFVEVRTVAFSHLSPDTVDLGEGLRMAIGLNGVPAGFLAVRSADAMDNYTYNKDYTVETLGQFGHYGIKRLAAGSIPQDVNILVSVEAYRFRERLTLQTENLLVVGSTPVALSKQGFLQNVWRPELHGMTSLLNDPALAAVSRSMRYIKVTYDNGTGPVTMEEGRDFVLTVDPTTKQCTLSRYSSGGTVTSRIPGTGVSVSVSYYTAEMFEVVTRYPQFVQQIAQTVEGYKHGCADVLVKSMQENTVDMDFTVEIDSGTTAEVVDRKIRTVITSAHDSAGDKLTQSELVRQIKALPGIKNVQVPFRHLTKSDESYDIGYVIPTGTLWLPMETQTEADASFGTEWNTRTFISKDPILRYKTRPSGGYKDAYVGMLYEGEPYKRMLSIKEIRAASTAAFYIVGVNDQFAEGNPVDSAHFGKIILVTPRPTATRDLISDPGALAFRLTYQVFGEAGAQDIPIGPTEYLRPGNITIDYVQEGKTK